MPWPGAGLDRRKGRLVRAQSALRRVEPVRHDLVEPEVAHERKAVGRIQRDAVGMRPRLAIGIDAPAGVLNDVRGCAEPAIRTDGQHRDAPAAVVRDQKVPALLVEDQMARASAHRRTLIQELQRSRRGIDRERAHCAGRLAFELVELVHREEEPACRVELEERWIRRLGRQPERDQRDVLRTPRDPASAA